MIRDYQAGITPNPDVLCNRSIKFGAFKEWALAEGADMVATGHYAQTRDGKLFRGADTNKDQSYFLYQLTNEDLRRTLFPIGHLSKTEVRKEAGVSVCQMQTSTIVRACALSATFQWKIFCVDLFHLKMEAF
jgi:tRNA-specific 2-thiouridylase